MVTRIDAIIAIILGESADTAAIDHGAVANFCCFDSSEVSKVVDRAFSKITEESCDTVHLTAGELEKA